MTRTNNMRLQIAVCCCLAAAMAHADGSYPARPIRMIVPVTPGGGADITVRALAQKLTEAWGQQIIVDNRPGAGGMVGMEIGAKATADGYTITEGSMGPLTVDISLYDKLPYDPIRDFVPIARAVLALNMLVVHPSVPVNSVKELIAYAKANPGKLNFGSSGPGRADHLAGELFNTLAGVKMQHIPYKGGAPAMIDLQALRNGAAKYWAAVASMCGRLRGRLPMLRHPTERAQLGHQLPGRDRQARRDRHAGGLKRRGHPDVAGLEQVEALA